MKLQKWRWLMLLTGFVVVLASASYFISYQSFIETEQARAQDRASHYHNLLVGVLNQHKPLLNVLTEDQGIIAALANNQSNNQPSIQQLNQRFMRYAEISGLEAIYLMDRQGVTQATSNFEQPTHLSFMHKNYAFRPYFKSAIEGHDGAYFAIGATTGTPGYFISHPVRDASGFVIGVLAAKINVQKLSVIWQSQQDIGFITNASGVIILANDNVWLYQTVSPLTAVQLQKIRLQKQFAGLHLPSLDWHVLDQYLVSVQGKDYLYTPQAIGNAGWVLHLLLDPAAAKKNAAFVALVISALVLLLLSWGLTVRSRTMKQSLLESEQNRRQLVQMNDDLEAEIHERHRTEKRLSLAQKKLVQASRMAALGQLSAAVIHELGQPLAAFKNYLAAAEIDPEGEDMDLFLIHLSSVAERMQNTTAQLRFFSRPDETEFSCVDLNQVALNAIELTRGQSIHAKVNVELVTDMGCAAEVAGHSLRLEQVVVNLLINAYAAVNEGGSVVISLEPQQDNWLVSVADNGAGFIGEDAEKLFEAFYTTKAGANGMGLGLAISAAIVNEHHGQIWAQNNAQGGAEFKLTIPRWVDG